MTSPDIKPLSKRFKLEPGASVVSFGRITARKPEPPLPMPFDLPRNFPTAVQIGLDEKALTGRARAKFITTIAQAVFRFKSYPTADEYRHIALQIVRRWKFLDTKNGHVSS